MIVISAQQAPPRRGPVRVFTLAVHRAGRSVGAMDVEAALWRVKRSEHDFHLLRAKLREFHGDALALQQLPSRRSAISMLYCICGPHDTASHARPQRTVYPVAY